MNVEYSKRFLKQYYKLPTKVQNQFQNRLELWLQNPHSPLLHVHALTGEYKGFYSLNVSGDIRALYRQTGESVVLFGFIGSHSQLYR